MYVTPFLELLEEGALDHHGDLHHRGLHDDYRDARHDDLRDEDPRKMRAARTVSDQE
jgi:hypothetical protein